MDRMSTILNQIIKRCQHSSSFDVQACRHGHVQHLEHLLFYGADMSSQNASGNTALHVCALYNQVGHIQIALCVRACVHTCG